MCFNVFVFAYGLQTTNWNISWTVGKAWSPEAKLLAFGPGEMFQAALDEAQTTGVQPVLGCLERSLGLLDISLKSIPNVEDVEDVEGLGMTLNPQWLLILWRIPVFVAQAQDVNQAEGATQV